MRPTKEQIKDWLKRFGHSREWLGKQCGDIKRRTVDNWLSSPQEIPESTLFLIARLMDDDRIKEEERVRTQDIPMSHLVLKLESNEFDCWSRAALSRNKIVSDWVVDSIREMYQAHLVESQSTPPAPVLNSIPFAKPSHKPHLAAAAGSPILSEVIDWEGDDDLVLIRVCGLSMSPLFEDGDVIAMKHRRASRSPFMKKGLVYLVAYDGGYTIKRYNTRPATAEEAGEEWATGGKVKVLESVNPSYPEIIIRQELEWLAWHDPKNPITVPSKKHP